MKSTLLTQEELYEYVSSASYPYSSNSLKGIRCIDGRYKSEEGLTPYAVPGADPGEMLVYIAATRAYGLDIEWDSFIEVYTKTSGGLQKLHFHTDEHTAQNDLFGGCGHIGQMKADPAAYDLAADDIKKVERVFENAVLKGVAAVVLPGDHKESGVLIVQGDTGLYPQAEVKIGGHTEIIHMFIYHQSGIDTKRKQMITHLLAANAIRLPEGCDAEYLFDAVSDIGENHLMETLKRIAAGLPIYKIYYEKSGGFEMEDMGSV